MSAGRLGLRRLPRPPAPRTSPAWQMAMARCRGQSSRLSACPSARLPQGRLQQIQMQSPPACHSGRGSSCQLEPGAACQKRPCSDASKNLSRHTAPASRPAARPKPLFPASRHAGDSGRRQEPADTILLPFRPALYPLAMAQERAAGPPSAPRKRRKGPAPWTRGPFRKAVWAKASELLLTPTSHFLCRI